MSITAFSMPGNSIPRNNSGTDGKIRFGMLGDLDSDWKGSDTAIEAFLNLPPEIADKCELHLAAFSQKKSGNRRFPDCHPPMD